MGELNVRLKYTAVTNCRCMVNMLEAKGTGDDQLHFDNVQKTPSNFQVGKTIKAQP